MTTPAGWYPDPSGPGGQRYFDGANWTEHQAVAPVRKRPLRLWIVAGALLLFFGGCGALLVVVIDKGSSRDPVTDGTFQFVVNDFAKASLQSDPQPRGEYVLADVTVTNTDNQPHSFIAQDQKLIDAAGHGYPAADMAALSQKQQTTVLDMKPGLSLKVRMRFDVPTAARLTAIELHDSASSPGATVSL